MDDLEAAAASGGPLIGAGSMTARAQIHELEECIRDLISLFALPSLWSAGEPEAMVDGFLEALLGMLSLDLAYVRIAPSARTKGLEICHGSEAEGAAAVRGGAEVAAQLRVEAAGVPREVASPLGLGALQAIRYPMGMSEETGEVVLAAYRPGFPRATERLLGRVAANQLQLRLEQAWLLAEREEADRHKDNFLAMLGHELRNPLAPIKNALHLMSVRGENQSTGARAVIERQVGHLTRLVDDILDVSRIGRGKVVLDRRAVDLRDVVMRALEMVRPLLTGKRHRLELRLAGESLVVDGDDVRLSQVVANLLTNAANYTAPRGEITVQAGREEGEVVLRVRDNGEGLAPELIPQMFDMFSRGARATEQAGGGLGLGLAIVRSLVELHGGRVEARSEGQARGSEFVVRLPGSSAPSPTPAGGKRAPAGIPGVRRRVLVVDDNHDAAETMGELLGVAGHEVRLAFDGGAALEVAESFAPEVVILDIGLPVLDGYEVAQRLRQRPGGEALRLVALTGYGQENDRLRSFTAGFDHHLVKPIDLDELLAIVAA